MISVALATYQGEKYIEGQLLSILSQNMPVDEIIIVDDCSIDNTCNILSDYSHRYHQIKLIKNDCHRGFISNFQKAISLCSGDFIFLCDQDDIWHNDKVSEMITVVKENPQIQVLASSFTIIDALGRHQPSYCSPFRSNHNLLFKPCRHNNLIQVLWKDLLFHNFSQGASLLITKPIQEIYLKKTVSTMYHDYYINLIGAYNNSLYFYNKELFDYRLHETNTIGLNKKIAVNKRIKISYCIEEPQKALDILNEIPQIFPNVLSQLPCTQDANDFLTQYILCLTNRKLITLLHMNFNPWYFKLKTWRGRINDILAIIVDTSYHVPTE